MEQSFELTAVYATNIFGIVLLGVLQAGNIWRFKEKSSENAYLQLLLFFTFCKVNPLDLRLHRWHWVVLVTQLSLTAGVYFGTVAVCRQVGVSADNTAIVSQGLMICLIMPTA